MSIVKNIFNLLDNNTQHGFLDFLKRYNCKYKSTTDEEDKSKTYYFDYQSGKFIGTVRDGQKGVEVIFPGIYEATVEDLENIRTLCNHYTSIIPSHKMGYTISDDKKTVNISIAFYCNIVEDEFFKDSLEMCFNIQRGFVSDFDNIKKLRTSDIERDANSNNREAFLINQHEINCQDPTMKYRFSKSNLLTLSQLLSTVLQFTDEKYKSLKIVTDDEVRNITETKDIEKLNLSSLLIEGSGVKAHFVRDSAILSLKYSSRFDLDGDCYATITLTRTDDDNSSLYYRITVSLLQNSKTGLADDGSVSRYFSLLVAYDKESPKKKQQEFDYMWKDAMAKIDGHDRDQLTEEQKLICDISHPEIAYCMFWGLRNFYAERYYEALLLFESAYRKIRYFYFQLKRGDKDKVKDVCYYIGFCYSELKQYEKAYYYLSFVAQDNNLKYLREYINVLVNSKNLRIFEVINNISQSLGGMRNDDDDEEEEDESIVEFKHFLRRRHACALVDFGSLDRAEREFTAMLKVEDSKDYAISELAYIKRLRKSQEAEEAADENKAKDEANDKANENKEK
jgi:hypothetical protein